jgi:hypothetical protein
MEKLSAEKSKERRNHIVNSFYDVECYKAFDLVDAEIEFKLGEPWRELKKINYKFVAVHTLLVLWRTVVDPLYPKYSAFE